MRKQSILALGSGGGSGASTPKGIEDKASMNNKAFTGP